jgi:hypothetical protein
VLPTKFFGILRLTKEPQQSITRWLKTLLVTLKADWLKR